MRPQASADNNQKAMHFIGSVPCDEDRDSVSLMFEMSERVNERNGR